MANRRIIGIDGGGTKTAVAIASLNAQGNISILGRGTGGASNILSAGQECAFESLDMALDAAYTQAAIPGGHIDCALLAMAGFSSPDVRRLLNQWAKARSLARTIALVSDIDPVMMAGTQDNWGLAVIVGTGSIVKGINRQGKTDTLGGWGYWFGDQGGGYDLGRQALIASVKAVDGIAPKTDLLHKICETLAVTQPSDIIVALDRGGKVPANIASLAKLVPDLAAAGDPVARRILKEAVGHIVALCVSLNRRLNFSPKVPIALAGGVMCHSKVYREAFKQALFNSELKAGQLTWVANPVDGCLALAKERLLA